MPREVAVIPHTHWDREWYEPFQTFRLKLVDLLDELLPLLERDPSYRHFMLDGQMAVVDDYLAVRPEAEDALRRLAVSGRLGMGPWYILMDEFLVSGETMVRDLQLGLERAGAFGGAQSVGYLPDMFGHIAQMPQLLRQFGLEHAVVWRGVPSAIERSGFWWRAPDGSRVRAEYLVDGYSNGAHLPDDAKDFVAAIGRFEDRWSEFLVGPILWMNGTDHLLPQPWLGRVVAEANEIQGDYRIKVCSLGEYLAGAPTDDLPGWTGELRSGARSNLLMGVASNRIDVKQAAAAAERTVERLAEPLAALHLPADRWPAALLAEAWKQLIHNSAHDSSCACSADEVDEAVLVRYREARQIGAGLAERAGRAVAGALAEAGPVVLNPSARRRRVVVELTLPGHDDVVGTQVLHRSGGVADSGLLTRDAVRNLADQALEYLNELRDAELVTDDDGTVHVHLHVDEYGTRRYTGDLGTHLKALADEDPDAPASIAMVFPVTQKVLGLAEVDGFGWRRWVPGPLDVEPVVLTGEDGDAVTITNGELTVVIDPTTGTFALDGVPGFGRLIDGGDTGDTYNYNPPAADTIVDTPDEVTVRVLERGPLRARVAIDRTYRWPESAAGGARVGEVTTPTTTTLEVVAGSPAVRCTTELDNRARDHRLRVWFPLPRPADRSTAECAFAVVDRPLTAEGGPNEHGLPTQPCRRFVVAGGLTVVHDGLPEYELVDLDDAGAHAVALTLLRCTGQISQGPMTYRALPAGPFTRTPAAQMPGHQVLRYAVAVNGGVEGAYALADDVLVPMPVHRATGGGERPDAGSALTVSGAEVSAVLREGASLTVRVFNPSPEPTTVAVDSATDGARGWLVDLRGRPLEPFEGSFVLRPWGIATARLTG